MLQFYRCYFAVFAAVISLFSPLLFRCFHRWYSAGKPLGYNDLLGNWNFEAGAQHEQERIFEFPAQSPPGTAVHPPHRALAGHSLFATGATESTEPALAVGL